MTAIRDKVAALMPLVERLHRGHCWIKTPDGPRRIDERLDDFKIAEHVAGRKAYGACPIAPGESTCRVAVLDFDSHKGETPWEEMARIASEVRDAARLFGLEAVPFRSSGGRGVHLIFLWQHPQDAYSVRALLRSVLSACDLAAGTGGVIEREVELFPKQDAVPLNGFGSMFVLPLAGESVLLGEKDE